jgi:hypothetical protein
LEPAAYCQNGKRSGLTITAQSVGNLQTINIGQAQIKKNQVGIQANGGSQCLVTRLSRGYSNTPLGHNLGEDISQERIVFNNQNMSPFQVGEGGAVVGFILMHFRRASSRRAGKSSADTFANLIPLAGEYLPDIGVFNPKPENECHQQKYQGIFNQALSVLIEPVCKCHRRCFSFQYGLQTVAIPVPP